MSSTAGAAQLRARAIREGRMRKILLLLALLAAASLAACAHQPGRLPFAEVPGFWFGIWHGLVGPIALVGSAFTDVRMYAFPNSGPWYDLGFLLGIGVWGGGGAAARRR